MNKRFIIKLILFPIPFIVIFLVNFIVDPFNFNSLYDLKLSKAEVSYKANYRLWKISEFSKNPCANILLGDSRIDSFDIGYISKITGEKYFNFAYGGGSLDEMIDTFWIAASRVDLKRVYFGINFNLFNGYNDLNLVKEALAKFENPLIKYYFNFWVLKVSLNNLLYKCTGINPYDETPQMGNDEFWNFQLTRSADSFYRKYAFPSKNLEALKNIRKYCHNNRISIYFIIPPTHTDLQNKVKEYNLSVQYVRYKKKLNEIGTVYDFEVDNETCRDRKNFFDPFHFNQEIMRKLCDQIFSINY